MKQFDPVSLWTSYRKALYPESIPPMQERECSSAFYAGMISAVSFFLSLDENQPDSELEQVVIQFHDAIIMAAKNARPPIVQ
jgi:hypothetical protein